MALDDDLERLDRQALIAETKRLRAGIRTHRDSSGHDLCWHHPELWGLLPEPAEPEAAVPPWPRFRRGCVRYREALDRELPGAPVDDRELPAERLVTLGAQDAGEVLTLQRAAYVTEAQAHDDLDLPPLRESLEELAAELTDPQVWAVGWREGTGRLLAAVRVRIARDAPGVAQISRLTVAPDRQGRGLGTRLLEAVEDRLPTTVTELRLFTGERSVANLRLYARLGYTELGREPTPAGYALIWLGKPRRTGTEGGLADPQLRDRPGGAS